MTVLFGAVGAAPVTLPQFDAPFRLDAGGQVAVVQQDTPEEIGAAALNVLVCPEGANTADPTFGVPSLLFGAFPADLTAIQSALAAGEPRAQYTLQEVAEVVEQASETILVQAAVGPLIQPVN